MSSSKIQELLVFIQKIAKVHDIEVTAKKIDKILKDGLDNLHIICDFDQTMTTHYKDKSTKERSPSAHSVFSRSKLLSDEFKKETQILFDKYYPIEIDTNLTREQKEPFMVEWWEKAHKLLIDQHIHNDDFVVMIDETPLDLREGIGELINKCKEKNVPFLVFSAGVKNVIEEVLIAKNLYHENMHVVSNELIFDPETKVCNGFAEPLIHIFNKSEITVKDSKGSLYHTAIENRGNVILLGNSLGDLQMSSGVKHDVCLNIGYLNYFDEIMLSSFLKSFDIVILDDGPMDVANMIMQAIDH